MLTTCRQVVYNDEDNQNAAHPETSGELATLQGETRLNSLSLMFLAELSIMQPPPGYISHNQAELSDRYGVRYYPTQHLIYDPEHRMGLLSSNWKQT